MDQDANDLVSASAPAACDTGRDELTRRAARAYAATRIDVDEALRRGFVEFWYQPKIELAGGCVVGAEALARIRHPERGVLLPKTFLPGVPDATMAKLTEQAVLNALQLWADFDAAGFSLRFAVNMPMNALRGLPIAGWVADNRPQAEHWPGLIVDVAAAQIVPDLPLAPALTDELAGAGIAIAIDDFGHSPAEVVPQPQPAIGEIKIDVDIVKNCAADAAKALACRNAIEGAHRLGIVAVAEGIETYPDLHVLQAMGCDMGQGVLIAPPLPRERFLDWLRAHHSHASPQPLSTNTGAVQGGARGGIDTVA